MIDERDIREMLERRASSISALPTTPAKAVRLARRRTFRNGALSLALVAGFAAGSVMGIQALRSADAGVPIDEPSPPVIGPGSPNVSLVDVRTGEDAPSPTSLHVVESGHELAISPDGRLVAFVASAPGPDEYGLFVSELSDARSEARRIALDVPLPQGGGVGTTIGGWSADSTRLVISDDRGHGLWIVDVPSGDATRILDDAALAGGTIMAPVFTPANDAVSFTVMHAESGGRERADLVTVPIGGGDPTVLVENAAFGTYSPDGSMLVYREARAASPIQMAGIMAANADGTEARHLMGDGASMSGIGPWSAAQIAWSPDGTKLLVTPPGYGWPNTTEFMIVDVSSGQTHDLGRGQSATWWDDDSVLVVSYGCVEFTEC